jgi:hypothetical protein
MSFLQVCSWPLEIARRHSGTACTTCAARATLRHRKNELTVQRQLKALNVKRLRHLLWSGYHDEAPRLLGCILSMSSNLLLLNGPTVEPGDPHKARRNAGPVLDYGRRSPRGNLYPPRRAESLVNDLVNAWMNKRRQMRWSPHGAHRVLQLRAAVLDGRSETKITPNSLMPQVFAALFVYWRRLNPAPWEPGTPVNSPPPTCPALSAHSKG